MAQWTALLGSLSRTVTRLIIKCKRSGPITTSIAAPEGCEPDARYEPCDLLLRGGIPCKVWGEDILSTYGVPTIVIDLFLLVSDPKAASQSMMEAGYVPTTPNERFAHIPELSSEAPRLVSQARAKKIRMTSSSSSSASSHASATLRANDFKLTGVVLLPAAEWGYNLPDSVAGLQELVPDISEYFDCIVHKWMELPEESCGLRSHLVIHIGYHSMYLDEVWTEEFEQAIRKEHRQLLFDLLGDGTAGRVDFLDYGCQIYHREIRDQILAGEVEPTYPANFIRRRVEPANVGTRVALYT